MTKQSIVIPCACEYHCHEEMTVRESDENTKLTTLTITNKDDPLRPKLFELDRDGFLALIKFGMSKYKLRDEIFGGASKTEAKKTTEKSVTIDPSTLLKGEQIELFETEGIVEMVEQPVKRGRGRGRPKKTR